MKKNIDNMQNKRTLYPLVLFTILSSLIWLSSCNDDDDGGTSLANEITFSDAGDLTITEKDTTIIVTYELIVPTREAGSLVIGAIVEDLTYGVNYSTSPAETTGTITIPFDAGANSVSFSITVIDDASNLPNGKVTFAISEVNGENAEFSEATTSLTLTILDNEGESIVANSDETVALGEAVPGMQSEAFEIAFTSLNIVSEISASASDGFLVGTTADGTFAAITSLEASATSFFVKASPNAAVAFGLLDGTVTLVSGEASTEFAVEVIVSSSIGVLFWVEDFDYPIDEPDASPLYPAYGENGFSGACVPVSAWYRLSAKYNGADATLPVVSGLERTGAMDTWYVQNRMTNLAMGDVPLTFTGYPGSVTGRTARIAFDGSQQRQNNNNCENWESKNSAVGRRFVENGSEITEGNVYFASKIKVNSVFSEADQDLVAKNAVMMLTGDNAFVGVNAMKLNIRDDGNGGFNFGVSKSGDDGSVIYGATSYSLEATYAVVFKVEIIADNEGEDPNDIVSLYVYEEGETIAAFDDESALEARIDASNQDIDVHDVTSGLEIFFTREVADAFNAGGVANLGVHDVEFSGLRIGTSWNALFKDSSEALFSSVSNDPLQTIRAGNHRCPDSGFIGGVKGNFDL